MSLPPYESHLQTGRITEMIEYTHLDVEQFKDHIEEQKSNSLKFQSEHRFAFKEKERTALDQDDFSQPHEPKPKNIPKEENKIGENAKIKPPR